MREDLKAELLRRWHEDMPITAVFVFVILLGAGPVSLPHLTLQTLGAVLISAVA